MNNANIRDPASLACRIYVGHLNETITQEILDVKFSAHGKINGFLRSSPGFAFIQYETQTSAANAIQIENGSFIGNQRILVKAAEMKSQKRSNVQQSEVQNDPNLIEPMNKKYFSEGNEYYGNNSIMAPQSQDNSDVNHCEIIVVSKILTQYAEEIEKQLKMLGIRVDLLFPNDQVPINKVLGNIQSRGCLYAILLLPPNMENRSLTLTILYGDASEHRNMPMDDAIRFVYKDFTNKTKKIQHNVYQHPEAVQTLLKNLAENRSLTVLQYDHIIKYLSGRREVQRKAEIGEDLEEEQEEFQPIVVEKRPERPAKPQPKSKDDLQKKILEILNKKSIVEELAKKVEPKSNKMTNEEKEELKSKLMQDDKIKQAMNALKNFRKSSK